MGIMVNSLLWVMQELYHQPYLPTLLLGERKAALNPKLLGLRLSPESPPPTARGGVTEKLNTLLNGPERLPVLFLAVPGHNHAIIHLKPYSILTVKTPTLHLKNPYESTLKKVVRDSQSIESQMISSRLLKP